LVTDQRARLPLSKPSVNNGVAGLPVVTVPLAGAEVLPAASLATTEYGTGT
jgi:hypothetical protein